MISISGLLLLGLLGLPGDCEPHFPVLVDTIARTGDSATIVRNWIKDTLVVLRKRPSCEVVGCEVKNELCATPILVWIPPDSVHYANPIMEVFLVRRYCSHCGREYPQEFLKGGNK